MTVTRTEFTKEGPAVGNVAGTSKEGVNMASNIGAGADKDASKRGGGRRKENVAWIKITKSMANVKTNLKKNPGTIKVVFGSLTVTDIVAGLQGTVDTLKTWN